MPKPSKQPDLRLQIPCDGGTGDVLLVGRRRGKRTGTYIAVVEDGIKSGVVLSPENVNVLTAVLSRLAYEEE